MINNITLNKIIELINNNKYFILPDFEITNNSAEFEVQYKLLPKYYFKLKSIKKTKKVKTHFGISSESSQEFSQKIIIYSPSSIYDIEEKDIDYDKEIFENFTEWLNSLIEELISEPKLRYVKDLESKINELINNMKNFTDESFSQTEIDDLKNKLNDFEFKIKTELEKKISEGNETLKDEIERLHNEIELLKATISKSNKKNWFKSLAIKIGYWISKPENQKVIIDGAKEFKKLIDPNE